MTKQRKQSLQQKLVLAFAAIIACIMAITLALHIRTVKVIRQMAYEKMDSQAEYYQQTFETEIRGILNLQLDFFNNRQLPFLAYPDSGLSAYEEREAVLSTRERIQTITEVSSLIQNGFLYIPGSQYYISKGTIRKMTEQDWRDMEEYLQNRDGGMQYDGENYYSIRTGEIGSIITEDPRFVFVLIFSSQQVEEKLSVLNTSEQGGVFLYNEEKKAWIYIPEPDWMWNI